MALQVITANRLNDGLVIFLTADGWSERLDDAATAEDDAAIAELQARADAEPTVAVGPYAIEVTRLNDGRLVPVRFREVLRTLGPSVRTDLGYQAA